MNVWLIEEFEDGKWRPLTGEFGEIFTDKNLATEYSAGLNNYVAIETRIVKYKSVWIRQ